MGPEAPSSRISTELLWLANTLILALRPRRRGETRSPPYLQNCDGMNFLLLPVTKWVVICHGNNRQGVYALLASRQCYPAADACSVDFWFSSLWKVVLTAKVWPLCVSTSGLGIHASEIFSLVPDHRSEVTSAVKRATWSFWFPSA